MQFGLYYIYSITIIVETLMKEENTQITTFDQLPLCEEMKIACQRLNYNKPTKIQAQSLPYTLAGRDIIALAQTGSGKTLAFTIPILQSLLQKPMPFTALVLAPARELCVQIGEHFKALGAQIGLKVAVIFGGLDIKGQVKLLNGAPHVVVGTPGKIVYHLQNTKSFQFKNIKYLVFDEADKLLSDDFGKQVNKIVEAMPQNRNTYLFSATMTDKVQKLQRASLNNPVKISVCSKYQTVVQLKENYIFMPSKFKEVYLAYILNQKLGKQIIIFTLTCLSAMKLCLLLRKLGHQAVTVNGQMSQSRRLGSLARFKARESNILVATDVASRGLDIPEVDLVVNYDLPMNPKDYIHRVGRTARAGRAGRALTFVSQYDVEQFQKIQHLLGHSIQGYEISESQVFAIKQSVDEKNRAATEQLKLKLQRKQATDQQTQQKYAKFSKKIKKNKIRNKKRRVKIDI